MLSELRTISAQRADLEELVEAAAFARALESEFSAVGVPSPEWLTNTAKSIRREIKSKNQDRLAQKLQSAKARLETLKTPDEKRSGLENEIKQLEEQLADA
jgi:hypothetical protein